MRDRAGKIEPSTAVSPRRASASRPDCRGKAFSANSCTMARNGSASKALAADSLKEASEVRRTPRSF
jgi:hypothetical protein